MIRSAFALFLLSTPVLADCPAAPDISAPMDALIAEAQAAPGPRDALSVSARMWALWTQAPDDTAQGLLDEGMAAREAFDLPRAVDAFDALIAYCPDYAEGYNQRAFANFLQEDFDAALPDLDRAIALRPRHVAAISGRGLTLIQLGRIRDGQDAIRAALALNPWLSERRFLDLDPDVAPEGSVDL